MKKILIPTDFSPCANAAVEVGLTMAEKFGAEIYLLHLHDNGNGPVHIPHFEEEKLTKSITAKAGGKTARAKAILYNIVAKAEHRGVKITPQLVFNTGNERVENYIEPFNIDLVVMGSHGVRGIRELVLGSNTQRLVHRASIPVLVVKQQPASYEFKNILFASAFDEDVTAPAEFVAEFAKTYQSRVHLLYINMVTHLVEDDDANDRMRQVMDHFPEVSFTANASETNDEEWAITQSARQLGADLIAVTNHEADSVFKLFSRNVAEKLVNHEEIPVLVFPTDKSFKRGVDRLLDE